MQLSMPDMRRGRLKKILGMKGLITAMEAHSGITGLIVENTTVVQDGKTYQFDAMWISSLCDSTAKGKPDIELVDMTSRFRTIDDIMEVTTKPILLFITSCISTSLVLTLIGLITLLLLTARDISRKFRQEMTVEVILKDAARSLGCNNP